MPYYTKEHCKEAKNVDIVELLTRLGVPLKAKGNSFEHMEHDSLKVTPGKGWNWFSQGKGGGPIEYLQEGPEFSYSYNEAISIIRKTMGLETGDVELIKKKSYKAPELDEKKEFKLPERNKDNRRVVAYLNKTRGIDYEFINRCIKRGIIYESAVYHNIVFVGADFKGTAKYASQRSSLASHSFKQDVAGSDKEYCFRIEGKGNSGIIRVFEAPIDCLSYLTLAKMKGINCEDDTMICLGGVSTRALDRYLQESKNKSVIVVCTDNDEAGKKCLNTIYEKYSKDYKVIENLPKGPGKDFNEQLLHTLALQKEALRGM